MASNFVAGCAICDNEFVASDTACAIRCGHTYHRNCLLRWFQARREKHLRENCPTCRAYTNQTEVIFLFLHQICNQTTDTATEVDELDTDTHSIGSQETVPYTEGGSDSDMFSFSDFRSLSEEENDFETGSIDLQETIPYVEDDDDASTEEFIDYHQESIRSPRNDDSIVLIDEEDSDMEGEIERDQQRRVEMSRRLQDIMSRTNGVDMRLTQAVDVLRDMVNTINSMRSNLASI